MIIFINLYIFTPFYISNADFYNKIESKFHNIHIMLNEK